MPNSITTVQGQAWDQIAKSRYGAETQMSALLANNVEESDALFLSGDAAVTVPGASTPARVRTLAPWEKI